MIRINKDIAFFSGIIVVIGISFLILANKLPRLLTHDTYYCQSTFFSLLTPIPSQLILIPLILMSIITLTAIIRLTFTLVKIHLLRKNIIKSSVSDMRFSKLLKKLHIQDKTYLIKSDKPFAFSMGILSPKIYISTTFLKIVNLKELEAVLYHELSHVKNNDSLTTIIASFGKYLFPFLPIISDFLKNYLVEREVKADKEAINGTKSKIYLISAFKKLLSSPIPPVAYAAAIVEYDTIESRIKAITNDKPYSYKKYNLVNAVISCIVLLFISLTLVGPVHAMHIDSRDIIILHATEDSCLHWAHNLTIH